MLSNLTGQIGGLIGRVSGSSSGGGAGVEGEAPAATNQEEAAAAGTTATTTEDVKTDPPQTTSSFLPPSISKITTGLFNSSSTSSTNQQNSTSSPTQENSTTTTSKSASSRLGSWFGGGGGGGKQEESNDNNQQQSNSQPSDDGTTTTSRRTSTSTEPPPAEPTKKSTLTSLLSSTLSKVEGNISSLKQGFKPPQISNPLSTFNSSQSKFISEQNPQKTQKIGPLPWTGHPQEQEFRAEVLGLSGDRRHFVRSPPPSVSFSFNLDDFLPTARALLKEDPNLEKMRYELVPKVVAEEAFWRNYWYRVTLLKESLDTKTSKPGNRDSSDDEGAEGPDDPELEKELNEELKEGGFEVVSRGGGGGGGVDLK